MNLKNLFSVFRKKNETPAQKIPAKNGLRNRKSLKKAEIKSFRQPAVKPEAYREIVQPGKLTLPANSSETSGGEFAVEAATVLTKQFDPAENLKLPIEFQTNQDVLDLGWVEDSDDERQSHLCQPEKPFELDELFFELDEVDTLMNNLQFNQTEAVERTTAFQEIAPPDAALQLHELEEELLELGWLNDPENGIETFADEPATTAQNPPPGEDVISDELLELNHLY